jgi:HSP20 family protein
MKVTNLNNTKPMALSDLLVGNFGSLVNDFFGEELNKINDVAFRPAIEVTEQEHGYTAVVALPGIKKEDITISLENSILKVSGERLSSKEENSDKVHFSEFRYGKFERSITLPKNAETEKVDARFEDGLLTINILKKEDAKPKQIEIK